MVKSFPSLNAYLTIKNGSGRRRTTPDLYYLLALRAWGHDAGLHLRILAANRAFGERHPGKKTANLLGFKPQYWDKIYNGQFQIPEHRIAEYCKSIEVTERWLRTGLHFTPRRKLLKDGYSKEQINQLDDDEFGFPEFIMPYFKNINNVFGTKGHIDRRGNELINNNITKLRSMAWYMVHKDSLSVNPTILVDLVCDTLGIAIPPYNGEPWYLPLTRGLREQVEKMSYATFIRNGALCDYIEVKNLDHSWRIAHFPRYDFDKMALVFDLTIIYPPITAKNKVLDELELVTKYYSPYSYPFPTDKAKGKKNYSRLYLR